MPKGTKNGESGASPDIVIIGAGFGGLTAGCELKRRGYTNFVIAERGNSVGGVWRDNRYPNCACDTPVDIYSLSFYPSYKWSCNFAPANELLSYARDVAAHHGLNDHIRLSTNITAARWSEADRRWHVTVEGGEHWTPRFLIWAGGRLSQPKIPSLPGLDEFKGEIFHTARWRDDVNLKGRKVALAGAGATAIQVVPHIAEQAEHFYAFMRTPPYVFPKPEVFYSNEDRQKLRENPSLATAARQKWADYVEEFARARFPMNEANVAAQEAEWRKFFEAEVKDPARREVLTPRYRMGCRRHSFSNDFYASLSQPNVTVLGTLMTGFTPTGVLTGDGREFDVDVVVLATGFQADELVGGVRVEGRNGVELSKQWAANGQEAYLGMLVKNFPNLFLIEGPNAELGSATIVIEAHARYIGACIQIVDDVQRSSIEIRADVQDAFNDEVEQIMSTSIMTLGGCHSWHRVGGTGRVFTHWPGTPSSLQARITEPNMVDLILDGDAEGADSHKTGGRESVASSV